MTTKLIEISTPDGPAFVAPDDIRAINPGTFSGNSVAIIVTSDGVTIRSLEASSVIRARIADSSTDGPAEINADLLAACERLGSCQALGPSAFAMPPKGTNMYADELRARLDYARDAIAKAKP